MDILVMPWHQSDPVAAVYRSAAAGYHSAAAEPEQAREALQLQ